jgi:hypothetical protein
VQAQPTAFDELRRLGVPSVPAVAVGERAVHGWNPPAYAALLRVPYTAAAKFAPRELWTKLDRVLACTARLLAEIPDRDLDHIPPERARTVRDLGYHVFRLSLGFVEAMQHGELPHEWLGDKAPAEMHDGHALASYGAQVRTRLEDWVRSADEREYARTIRVYYGPQSGHDLFERTAWHAGQHLRQLYVLAERLKIRPPEPLPLDALAGLPLPEAVW